MGHNAPRKKKLMDPVSIGMLVTVVGAVTPLAVKIVPSLYSEMGKVAQTAIVAFSPSKSKGAAAALTPSEKGEPGYAIPLIIGGLAVAGAVAAFGVAAAKRAADELPGRVAEGVARLPSDLIRNTGDAARGAVSGAGSAAAGAISAGSKAVRDVADATTDAYKDLDRALGGWLP